MSHYPLLVWPSGVVASEQHQLLDRQVVPTSRGAALCCPFRVVLPNWETNVAKTGGPYFRIEGYIGDLAVTATWANGSVEADEELIDRARELVEGGWIFTAPGLETEIAAGFDDPTAAVLTLIRSFGRIRRAVIEIPDDGWGHFLVSDGHATRERHDEVSDDAYKGFIRVRL